MVRKTGILNQEQVDELLGKEKEPVCEKCEERKTEIKAVQRTMNVMLNQAASELESEKKENAELRKTIEQLTKD